MKLQSGVGFKIKKVMHSNGSYEDFKISTHRDEPLVADRFQIS